MYVLYLSIAPPECHESGRGERPIRLSTYPIGVDGDDPEGSLLLVFLTEGLDLLKGYSQTPCKRHECSFERLAGNLIKPDYRYRHAHGPTVRSFTVHAAVAWALSLLVCGRLEKVLLDARANGIAGRIEV